ncbi:MAG: ATP-binding cassette domain-containing protein [Euzebyales bacterium]|jgi:putative ABC transport system ATP-binding protein|nr:ATP-binding cassette domain-containing protein [Euzebyales bacterium]MDQ3343000.1 ATP-binding cassette domain-containing protein [Actinomycetota bacterium]
MSRRYSDAYNPAVDQGVVVRAYGLRKTYRRGSEEVLAVRGVALQVGEGELVALVGPSGSGKSTLLNLLAGWEEPDSGTVSWRGGAPGRQDELGWDELAIVPQRLGLAADLSVAENVAWPLRLAKSPDDQRVAQLLDRFGLSALADRLPAEGSLGEQQRAALARALVRRPRLLLADEPTGHQDEDWAKGVAVALRGACAEGSACLLATHNAELLDFADRVLRLHDGRLGGPSGLVTLGP